MWSEAAGISLGFVNEIIVCCLGNESAFMFLSEDIMEINKGEAKMNLVSFLETQHRELLRPQEVSRILGVSTETIYDWKYRAKKRNIPLGMFVKISSMLFIRSDLLRDWISKSVN